MKLYKIIFVFLLCASYAFASKEIIIDLGMQKIYAIEDGEVILESRISTGKPGHRTPVGKFKITQKKRHHISTIYHLPMPFMMRLTNYGIAIHQGYVPDYPASHGCIRVPRDYAEQLFHWAPMGTPVHVKQNVEYADVYKRAPEAKKIEPQKRFDGNYTTAKNKRVTIDDFL
ncbi:MAG: L,D-transpeptidase family protein [Sulfurovaceae bacterium]|jgi:hypothetical protein